ncbi:MAG TPA: peptidoglycan-associated lipoprotein Pal [Burkholderiales bacterium]|nr:peptidoglycan-associated lipoprotein Pal [Burkholderiales bacterium]HXJ52976.1 peptidoglycan-associated lipoprotein Pal [Burkholderiales bacterium]
MRAYYSPILVTIAIAALIAGCSTTNPEGTDASGAPVTDATKKPGAGAQTGPIAKIDVTKPGAVTGADPRLKTGALAQRSIYYDLDQFDVKDQYRSLVEAHAKYLRENPSAKILIQGNTDERGSREYNVGLGQRRSDGVKKMLVLLGARDNQIESVSLGEEKPQADGHDESAWSKNRRSDILYSGEY